LRGKENENYSANYGEGENSCRSYNVILIYEVRYGVFLLPRKIFHLKPAKIFFSRLSNINLKKTMKEIPDGIISFERKNLNLFHIGKYHFWKK